MENKIYRIVFFKDIILGESFRFKKEWCKKISHLVYIDSHNRLHPAPKIFQTLVAAEKKNCL